MIYFWLCLSAIAAGAVNAVAGGGTLLTFPALETALAGVDPEFAAALANATSTVALFPGSFASVWGYRSKLPACKRWVLWLTLPSLVGGLIGASLVDKSFRFVIPYLILSAAILFALQPMLARMFRKQSAALQEPTPMLLAGIVSVQFLIGIYGGYFGAGIGILMLSSLSFLGLKDIHEINALKSYLAFCMNAVAAARFIVDGMVEWPYACAMAAAAILGGYLGARFSLLLPTTAVRWIVIAIGFGLAAYYFGKSILV